MKEIKTGTASTSPYRLMTMRDVVVKTVGGLVSSFELLAIISRGA